jgi:CMP/dCMP kinase
MAGNITCVRNSVARVAQAADGHEALVIAVDGPSGSGKSSAARGTAARLGLCYLDTGAMYRAVTWWLLEHSVDLADTESVIKHGIALNIEVSTDPGAARVLVDGIDVTREIRSRRVSNEVSQVASVPQIRAHLIGLQQAIIAQAAAAGGIVAEGRDIGTVVAPDAAVKVFLTASEQARAERRAAELAGNATVTRADQAQRDRRDAPQTQVAADATQIDATNLDLEEVIGRIVGLAAAKRTGRK